MQQQQHQRCHRQLQHQQTGDNPNERSLAAAQSNESDFEIDASAALTFWKTKGITSEGPLSYKEARKRGSFSATAALSSKSMPVAPSDGNHSSLDSACYADKQGGAEFATSETDSPTTASAGSIGSSSLKSSSQPRHQQHKSGSIFNGITPIAETIREPHRLILPEKKVENSKPPSPPDIIRTVTSNSSIDDGRFSERDHHESIDNHYGLEREEPQLSVHEHGEMAKRQYHEQQQQERSNDDCTSDAYNDATTVEKGSCHASFAQVVSQTQHSQEKKPPTKESRCSQRVHGSIDNKKAIIEGSTLTEASLLKPSSYHVQPKPSSSSRPARSTSRAYARRSRLRSPRTTGAGGVSVAIASSLVDNCVEPTMYDGTQSVVSTGSAYSSSSQTVSITQKPSLSSRATRFLKDKKDKRKQHHVNHNVVGAEAAVLSAASGAGISCARGTGVLTIATETAPGDSVRYVPSGKDHVTKYGKACEKEQHRDSSSGVIRGRAVKKQQQERPKEVKVDRNLKPQFDGRQRNVDSSSMSLQTTVPKVSTANPNKMGDHCLSVGEKQQHQEQQQHLNTAPVSSESQHKQTCGNQAYADSLQNTTVQQQQQQRRRQRRQQQQQHQQQQPEAEYLNDLVINRIPSSADESSAGYPEHIGKNLLNTTSGEDCHKKQPQQRNSSDVSTALPPGSQLESTAHTMESQADFAIFPRGEGKSFDNGCQVFEAINPLLESAISALSPTSSTVFGGSSHQQSRPKNVLCNGDAPSDEDVAIEVEYVEQSDDQSCTEADSVNSVSRRDLNSM